MKKILLSAAVFVLSVCMVMKTDIYAEDANTEHSDNNTFEAATELQTGQSIEGTIKTSIDIDYYKYTVNETGVYRIGFMEKNSDDPLYMAVYDSEKNLLEEMEYDFEEDTFMYTKKYEWEPGTVIYLKLFPEEEEDEININADYEIKPEIVKLRDTEQEPNDSLSNASTIRNGVDIYGAISENEDTDYYCYTAEKTGTATLKFYCSSSYYTFGWNIEVYDSEKKKLRSILETTDNKKRTFQVKKGQKYYLKIYGGETCFNSNEAILNKQYRINIQL